jgi:hypothetical protein
MGSVLVALITPPRVCNSFKRAELETINFIGNALFPKIFEMP